jgi:hypothetical protein
MKFKIKTLMVNLAAFAATTAAIAATATSALALSITQESNTTTLLNTLLGTTSGLSNFTATRTGLDPAFGTFSNDTVFGLGSGVVLSTGDAVDAVGPNDTSSKSGPGNIAQLNISFDADNTADKLFFQYVFGSEEFPEYAGTSFNDSFELMLNGVNLALLSNGNPVTINNLASSSTGPFDPALVVNTGNETQLDAYTKILTFEGLLNKNANNTLSIKIQDVGDSRWDSAVFVKAGTLGVVKPDNSVPTPALLPGLVGLGLSAMRKRKAEAAELAHEA